MLKGFVQHRLKITGMKTLNFDAFDVTLGDIENVDCVSISAHDEWHIDVKVHFLKTKSIEVAEDLSRTLVNDIASCISFVFDVAIEEPLHINSSMSEIPAKDEKESPSPQIVKESMSTTGFISGYCLHQITDEETNNLQTLIQSRSKINPDVAVYRWILRQQDPAIKFMHLYRILWDLEGANDNQKGIDNFIKKEEPNVALSLSSNPKLRKKNVYETVYTRIRNEIAHVRKSVTPQSTIDDANNYWQKLACLVKIAIENNS